MLCFPSYEEILVINFINTGNKVLQQTQWCLPPQLCSPLKDRRAKPTKAGIAGDWYSCWDSSDASDWPWFPRMLPGEWLAEPLRVSGSGILSQDGTHHTTKSWLCYRFIKIYFSRLLTCIYFACRLICYCSPHTGILTILPRRDARYILSVIWVISDCLPLLPTSRGLQPGSTLTVAVIKQAWRGREELVVWTSVTVTKQQTVAYELDDLDGLDEGKTGATLGWEKDELEATNPKFTNILMLLNYTDHKGTVNNTSRRLI